MFPRSWRKQPSLSGLRRPCPSEDLFYGQHAFMTTGRNLRACQTSKTNPRRQAALSLDSTAGCTSVGAQTHSSSQAPTRCLESHLSCPTQQHAGQQALQLFSSASFKKQKTNKQTNPQKQKPTNKPTNQKAPNSPVPAPHESQPQPEPSLPLWDFCASLYLPRKSAVMTPEAPFETNVISRDKACLW